MRSEVRVENLEALAREAQSFVGALSPKTEGATLVTLSGDLGAGKTAFTQAVARALGITEAVTSPTFVLAKSYALPEGFAFRELFHVDAYRLSEGKDLKPIGLAERMEDTGALVFLEWPEIVAGGLPGADVAITIRANDDGSRTITYA